MKILIIEDDEYSRDAFAHLLVAEGYEVDCAEDGKSGYARAMEFRPDVIVLDLILPDTDGREVIKKIRADGVIYSTRILVVTGRVDQAASAVNSGADGYLTKPVRFQDFIQALSRFDLPSTR